MKAIASCLLALSLASCQIYTDPVDLTGMTQVECIEGFGNPETITPNDTGGETYTYRRYWHHVNPGGRYFTGTVVENCITSRYFFNADGICYRHTRR